MSSPRIFAALLVIGCLPALAPAQDHSSNSAVSPEAQPNWKIQLPYDFSGSTDKGIVISVDDPKAVEHDCLMMRTYTVARDSKDSDSVHMLRYTTCTPSSRYGLKTTVERSGANQHAILQY